MKILLDTHAFLWYSAGDSRLSEHARSMIEDRENDRLLSVASLIEMALKASLGKLTLSDSFEQFANNGIVRLQCRVFDITIPHLGRLSTLPFHHRDPFDRILIAQTLVENIDIVSVDQELDAYGVRRHW